MHYEESSAAKFRLFEPLELAEDCDMWCDWVGAGLLWGENWQEWGFGEIHEQWAGGGWRDLEVSHHLLN